jgi:hypothetical protein
MGKGGNTTHITVDVLEASAQDVAHVQSGEPHAQRLPGGRNITNAGVPPEIDIATVVDDAIVGTTITVDVGEHDLVLGVALVGLDHGAGGEEGGRGARGAVAVALVDRHVGVAVGVDAHQVVQPVARHVDEV